MKIYSGCRGSAGQLTASTTNSFSNKIKSGVEFRQLKHASKMWKIGNGGESCLDMIEDKVIEI